MAFPSLIRNGNICVRCRQKLQQIQLRTFSVEHNDLKETQSKTEASSDSGPIFNPANIQMLSSKLHQQVFKGTDKSTELPSDQLDTITRHLKAFDLWKKKTSTLSSPSFQLPPLEGNNIDEHFRQLASSQTAPYIEEIEALLSKPVPAKPDQWEYQAGWTRYDPDTGQSEKVRCPREHGIVFDVEVLMSEGNFPTLATAVTHKAWYSWCSEALVNNRTAANSQSEGPRLADLVPLEYDERYLTPRLIIGHNVGFDRSFIKEQYHIQGTKLRCLDTMSLHIAVAGLTSLQRILYVASKTGSQRKEVREHQQDQALFKHTVSSEWIKESSLNNLSDVYQLYCKGPPLNKSARDVFISGNMRDVRSQFQELMNYCSEDVRATLDIFKVIWPQFCERFPHPVTLAGMLEMGTAYLPINHNWQTYLDEATSTYNELQVEMNNLLQKLAEDAHSLLEGKRYKKSVWLWDLDWKVRPFKYKKSVKAGKTSGSELAEKQPFLAGYPKWYIELCPKPEQPLDDQSPPRPSKITTQRRITPKLLQLTWDGYPLHYNDVHGWGYLVPRVYRDDDDDDGHQRAVEMELEHQENGEMEEAVESDEEEKKKAKSGKHIADKSDFSHSALVEVVARSRPEWVRQMFGHRPSQQKTDRVLQEIHTSTGEENQAELWKKFKDAGLVNSKVKKKKNGVPVSSSQHPVSQPGIGPFLDVLPNCDFYKLPHKDGESKRVGNPLAKDFLSKIEEGVLMSASDSDAEVVLRCSKMCSYWKNNMDRIRGQMAVYMTEDELPFAVTSCPTYEPDGVYGAILPRVVTAGTVTRRAVESTWLTASNAYADRVGSELKSMIQTPPGYHFVGADVDSQELWIAAVLGDAHFASVHGSTAFGWMTLQGNKADATDLHSRTAALVGILRDQAKIFNYGRIYGAGVRFAEQLLRQFNHRLTAQEARRKAKFMYESTKGRRFKVIKNEGGYDEETRSVWQGGSESYMFNKLEEIALSDEPKTPVLGCKISKSLEPKNVAGDFMTSRVNWVVQSSAVDYLHLMLVCMRWLLETYDIQGRFSISIHDEVRYLVSSEDRYRAALALQITNLFTRAMFSHKLGMDNLPQSVAFFSAVDIDKCMRKEVTLDSKTPSNPEGLAGGYDIQQGEALTVNDILEKTSSSLGPPPSADVNTEELEDMVIMSPHLL